MSFKWTTGEDENHVYHKRLIDVGGFGEVHEVATGVYCMLT